MTIEQKQFNRLEAMHILEDLRKRAFSGLTSPEYDAIKTAYRFIVMCYERDMKR